MLRVAYAVPVIGWLLRDAVEGRPSARAWFIANLAMIWFLAIYFFGYPALIYPLLFMTGAMLVTLVRLTAAR
ncbi:hypothetical protein [Amorphus sp. 3PC139-8]|uniref:hypothetical protein n=1 Tax=Amorphus sp. 3PC139-8 TaxID=2735676 RepID=UPI00345D75F4